MSRLIKKILRASFFILTSFSILAAGVPKAAAYTNPITTLRIGLCYEGNGTAMSTLKLTNVVGKGFIFGSFDASRKFVKNAVTGAQGLSSIDLNVKNGVLVVTNPSNNSVIYQAAADAPTIAIMPVDSGTAKSVTGTNWSYKYYGGFEVTALKSGKMQVINVVNIDDYVKGVVPVEMSASWPLEALKAQAMCARNFVVNHIGSHGDFDVCDTDHCQVYAGTTFATANSDAAVDGTAGKYVLYNDKPCTTFFYSSNGGATESSENVWVTALPYLVAKFDDYEQSVDTGKSSWTFTYTAAEITELLKKNGYSIGTVTSITPTYTSVGNILSLTFSDGKTTVTVKKQEAGNILCSSALGKYTYSQRFTITGSSSTRTGLFINSASNPLESIFSTFATGGDGGVSKVAVDSGKISVMTGSGLQTIDSYGSGRTQTGDTFVVNGSGWGHNVGMSQYGAKAMALMGKTYEEIIKYYFSGVTIG